MMSRPEELLAHGPFLRRLAHALLEDGHGAEDVVQDAYLAALRRPLEPQSPRAWLRAVVRNLALRWRRTRRRRDRRERAVARSERLPSTADAAAQVELQEKVLAALRMLEEPYRRTVVLRFYFDRTPTEIARDQGISVETVKTRLKRAVRLLRVRLDRAHGGRAWAPMLAVLSARDTEIPLGVLLMAKKTTLVVAVALVALAIGVRHYVSSESPPARATTVQARTPAWELPPAAEATDAGHDPEADAIETGSEPAETGSSSVAVDPAAREPTFLGHVSGERGGAVPGVHVVLVDARRQVLAFSSPDGRFQITDELVGPVRVGFATWPASPGNFRTSPQPVFEGVEQQASGNPVLRFRGIAGRVFGPDDQPVETGLVVARREDDGAIVRHAPIAGPGWFAFYGMDRGVYRLSYKRKIYGWEWGAVEGGSNVQEWQTDVVLRLVAGDTIEGIVFDPQGKPKSDIYLRAAVGQSRTGIITDPEGRFCLENLQPGMTYRLTVFSTGFVPEIREVPAGAKDVRFQLDPGLDATGRILDQNGKPKQIAQLLVRAGDGREIRSYPSTDQEGRFRLSGLPPGEIQLWSVMDGQRWVWKLRAGDSEVDLRPEIEESSGLLASD